MFRKIKLLNEFLKQPMIVEYYKATRHGYETNEKLLSDFEREIQRWNE